MIATQMGDTQYRGRIIWMLLTARPDLLPIDLKRQGRAEVHIPLFYPTDENENPTDVRDSSRRRSDHASHQRTFRRFRSEASCPARTSKGMVGRAWRTSPWRAPTMSRRKHSRGRRAVHAIDAGPWSASCRRRRRYSNARIGSSCRRRFVEKIAADGGRAKLQERLTALKQIVRAL